jgi:Flp pilus assembly protein protease CpaA
MDEALLVFDIVLLAWLSIEDFRHMKVTRWRLYIFLAVSLVYAIYSNTYSNLLLAGIIYILLNKIPNYRVGGGDQRIFASLALQFGLIPLVLILFLSSIVAILIPKGRTMPFIPVIFGAFVVLLHYTSLLGTL